MLEAKSDTYGWAKERVLRVLLDPVFGVPGGNSLYRVAKNADVSYPWTYDTWRDLVAAGAFRAPRGREDVRDIRHARLADVEAAFRYWLQHRPRRMYADYHIVGALDFLKSLESRRDLEYAATTYLAENLIQGHLFPRRFDLYVRGSQAAAWAAELGRRGFPIDSEAAGRGTLRLVTAADDARAEMDSVLDEVAPVQRAPLPVADPLRGFWVVRLPLLIVDLLEEGGACVEAAGMLMEKTYGSALHRT